MISVCYYLAGACQGQQNERIAVGVVAFDPSAFMIVRGSLEAVAALAAESGFTAPEVVEMPANNLSVVFRKA